jgi:transforming growth factor-beta-induced protein
MSRVVPLVAFAFFIAVSTQVALAGNCSHSKGDHLKDIVDTAVAAGDFKTLAAALTEAGLVKTLKGKGPFTVFAPTDKAFAKLPKGTVEELLKPENKKKLISILTYHVVPGRVMAADVVKLSKAKTAQGSEARIRVKDGKVYVDKALVTVTDIKARNGVIHVIDSVILPGGNCGCSKGKHSKDIVDTAVAAGDFKNLAAALEAADLIETLKGKGPFTVFAPTDKAFAKLPKGTVKELLKPENKQKLVSILTYHVVPGRVMAADVVKLSKAKTAEGSEVRIRVKDGKVYVDDALVTATDIKTRNGVIHVIDSVILPD